MNTSKVVIFFYLLGIVLLIAEVFDIKILQLAPRILMLPLLYWVYIKKTKLTHWGVSLVFLFYFFGEISSFLSEQIGLKYSLIFFGLGHLVLSGFAFKLINEKSTKKLLYYSIPIILLWLVYYEFYFRDAFGDTLGHMYPFVMGYSITVVLLNVLANVSFFNSGSQLTLYLIIIAVSIIVGDAMMSMYLFFNPINLFKVINVLSHLISYIFLLKFATDYEGFKLKSTYLP
jgi:hypothetical protein